MKNFRISILVTAICLAAVGHWEAGNGVRIQSSIFLAISLGVMKVSLSFDNASILKDVDAKWQQIFVMLGVRIAVVREQFFFLLLSCQRQLVLGWRT